MNITLDEAVVIVNAAREKAKEIGIPMSFAVVDPHGDLVAFQRMYGSTLRSIFLSQGKAMASVHFSRPSGELSTMADSPISRSLSLALGGRFIPHQGALPILSGQEMRGAVGVSGGPSQRDEEVAQAGMDALFQN
ncbi:heme-binding protein [Chloroflexota bacterium]